MPTINFHLGSATVNWDGGNTRRDRPARRARATRPSATSRARSRAPPAAARVIADIVDFETSLSTAQIFSFSAGFLNAGGARGGPEELSLMMPTAGPFQSLRRLDRFRRSRVARRSRAVKSCSTTSNRRRAPLRRLPQLGQQRHQLNNLLFDIGTASADARTPDLPLYTLRNRTTGEERQLTDTGRGNVTGLWADLGRFKTPTLRALAARAPYFHNGIAATLEDVVRHYETPLGLRLHRPGARRPGGLPEGPLTERRASGRPRRGRKRAPRANRGYLGCLTMRR